MNQTKLYVGNLSYQTTSDDLRESFASFGDIAELKLITDRDTGRSKGFAFVTYETNEAAEAALSLNDTTLDGRQIKVNYAKEGQQRSGGGGSRFGGGGSRFGGGGAGRSSGNGRPGGSGGFRGNSNRDSY